MAAINQAPAPQELKQLALGSNELALAIQSRKIKDSNEEEIKQALRYAMILVGIRAQNFPQEEEKAVLLSFIRRNYSGHTPAEIRLAFDKAVAGELNLKSDEVKCYENFSCEYVGRIMKAYRAWAVDKAEAIPAAPPALQIEAPIPSSEEILQSFYQDFLEGALNARFLPSFVYDLLAKLIDLQFSEEQLKSFVLRSREMVFANYSDELKVTDADKKLGHYLQIKQRKEALKAMDPLDSCNDANVNRQAKILAVIHFFTEAKESGAKTLTFKK